MKNSMTLALVFLFGALVVVSCDSYGQVYCGRRLANTLALLCENNLLVKRTMAKDMPDGFGWPWIPQHRANALGRAKRQVVSECCEKACTIDELLSYC
ncbi:unnamed protein product, partial [Iphiclides podalirius]